MTEPVLCYIKDNWAYFTTNLEDQWGDDWDDAPYEHNAGEPLHYDDCQVTKVAWEANLIPPCDRLYRYFSVDYINSKGTPWLTSPEWENERNGSIEIWAGTPLGEFKELIAMAGGIVYEPSQCAANQPSNEAVQNYKWALCSLMDGMKEHEIHQITGLPNEDCKKIWSIYVSAL